MSKVFIIGSFADSLINFRGPFLREVHEKKHNIIACATGASTELVRRLRDMDVKYFDVPIDRRGLNPLADIHTLIKLFSLLKRVKPDIMLGYTIKPVLYGSLAAQLAGVPRIFSIITGRGYIFSDSDFRQKITGVIARALYKVSLKTNEKVFFQNTDDVMLFEKYGLLIRSDQSVLLNGSGIDIDYFKPAPFPEKISFLLIARLIKDKGIIEYVNAARIVKEKHPDIVFRLIGPAEQGPGSVSINVVNAWCKEGVIEYLGELKDVRPAIANASVYVLPSYFEGTPRTVLEAMAMGRPIITTDAPGCRETVREGFNGFLVPVKDTITLANTMIKFIEYPEFITEMGQQSRKITEDKYDVHKVNAVILETMGL
jgi:glycosyltransferase involved in cell wall biosynthesis